MYKYLLIMALVISIFTGCISKNKPEFTTKEYKGINKNAILNAAKKVIKLSDNRYNIKSNSNSINAKRAIVKFKGFDADLVINSINLQTKQEDNTTKVKLVIKQKKDYFDKDEIVIKDNTHNLIWDRIDYILGLKKQWPTCFDYKHNFKFDGVLCNIIYNQNNNGSKDDIISDSITIKKDQIKEEINIIKDIKLNDLSDIKLPITNNIDSNNTTTP